MSGLGPMLGQANFFTRMSETSYRKLWLMFLIGSAQSTHQYSIDPYVNESRRLLRVLDGHLAKKQADFVVGDRLTIADIAIWPWVFAISEC